MRSAPAQWSLPSAMTGMASVSMIGADELLGIDVVDRDGGGIGVLRDLLLDLRLGRIAYVLVALDRDRAMARGEHRVAVPWNVTHVDDNGNLRVNASRDRVERAPSQPAGVTVQPVDHEWAVFIHSYFGAKPYWERNAQHS